MDARRRALAALNVLGGLAVLGSYAYAFSVSGEVRSALWGGVPESLRPLYTVNMLLAAAGYFPFSYLLVLELSPERYRSLTGWSHGALFAFYALVLLPSAAWLPLTAHLIVSPSTALWLGVRLVLFAVGIGALGLLVSCLRVARREGGASAWLAFVGTLPFSLQTAVLDALVWPAYFPLPTGG